MTASQTDALARFVAGWIRDRSVALADAWIETLRERLEIRPARFLPTDSVRDHVPELVTEVADHLPGPHRRISPDTVSSLRSFGELRREQGYDESEVLAELGSLHLCIFNEFGGAPGEYPGDASPLSVAEVARRLYQILDELESLVIGVLRERERLEDRKLSRRLADFAHTLLHEIRDPLNSAMGSVGILSIEDVGSEKEVQLRNLALRNLTKIRDILSDLSLVGDVETVRANGRRIRLRDAVDEVLDQCAGLAREKDVAVEVRGEVPDVVVDAGAVEIALRNLVWNAIKYADPEQDRRWVRISFSFQGEGRNTGAPRWRISVADNGVGIPEDAQDQVFDRHFRVDPDLADGSGLGLSIAQQMARQRGGRIWFESTLGEGSTFHLEVRELLEEPEEG